MSKSFVSSLLVSLVIALGIAAAWSVIVMWVVGLSISTMQRNRGYELLYVTSKGEPVLARISSKQGAATQEIFTLGGQPLPVDAQELLYPQYVGGDALYVGQSGESWNWRLAAASDGRTPATYWYLVHDGRVNGRAYGIGYHAQTKVVAGYFGTRGFAAARPPRDEWFEVAGTTGFSGMATNVAQSEPFWSPTWGWHVLASGKLWSIDPKERTIKPLADCPGAQALGIAHVVGESPSQPPSGEANSAAQLAAPTLLVREPERLRLVDPLKGTDQAYPVPPELNRVPIAAFSLADGQLLLVSREIVQGTTSDYTQHAVWIDREGQVVRREKVRPQGFQGGHPSDAAWIGVAAAPMPLAGLAAMALVPPQVQASGEADSYAGAVALTFSLLWRGLAALLAIGTATGVAAYRRQKRFGLPHAVGWAVFAFLLGIPGWIAYRFHRPWPVLEECPACRQAAPRDREACTECGADFPPPPLKGIEVFA
jgi:hypothetical protein